MQFSNSLLAFFLYATTAGIQQALAVHVSGNETSGSNKVVGEELVSLAGGTGNTEKDPIQIDLKIKNEGRLAFDADCYAILCLGAPRVLQRVNEATLDDNRKKSGANSKPFKKQSTRPKKHTPWSNQEFTSPEEFPFASTFQGGDKAYLFPVNHGAQLSQGGTTGQINSKVKQFDPKKPKNHDGTWYELKSITVHEKGQKLGPYCEALGENDKKVCNHNHDATGDWGYDVGKYAYKKKNGKLEHVGKK